MPEGAGALSVDVDHGGFTDRGLQPGLHAGVMRSDQWLRKRLPFPEVEQEPLVGDVGRLQIDGPAIGCDSGVVASGGIARPRCQLRDFLWLTACTEVEPPSGAQILRELCGSS